MSSHPDTMSIRQHIDGKGMSLRQWLIVFVCFLLNVADGFDVVAMAVAAPALAGEWGIQPQALGVIFSAALLGMALGAMFITPMSDVIGRRRMVLASTLAIGLAMVATAYATSITQLVILRTVTGLGIGVILVVSNTLATEFAPEKLRNLCVVLVTSGFSCGALLVGPIAGLVMPTLGWEALFIGAGICSLLIFALAFVWLPESLEFIAAKTGNDDARLRDIQHALRSIGCDVVTTLPSAPARTLRQGSVRSLLSSDFAGLTLKLWFIFILGFATNYFLASWIPSLLVGAGYTRAEGFVALTVYTGGGVLGVWSVGLLTTRMRMKVLLPPVMMVATAMMLAIAFWQPEGLTLLTSLMFVLGATTVGGFTGVYAVAARSYPAQIRGTGVGWCLGLGRFGAIVAPTLAGWLVAMDWTMYSLFILFGIPFAIAALIMVTIDA